MLSAEAEAKECLQYILLKLQTIQLGNQPQKLQRKLTQRDALLGHEPTSCEKSALTSTCLAYIHECQT